MHAFNGFSEDGSEYIFFSSFRRLSSLLSGERARARDHREGGKSSFLENFHLRVI